MSKSKNNGVDPQALIETVRRRHRAPVHDVRRRRSRRSNGLTPASKARYRFLRRIWNFGHAFAANPRLIGATPLRRQRIAGRSLDVRRRGE